MQIAEPDSEFCLVRIFNYNPKKKDSNEFNNLS